MTEQMQDRFERLDDVDGMLEDVERWMDEHASIIGLPKVRVARHTLAKTIAQLRADYGQMARVRDAAVNLLTRLRNMRRREFLHGRHQLPARERDAITAVIALLGGEDEQANGE